MSDVKIKLRILDGADKPLEIIDGSVAVAPIDDTNGQLRLSGDFIKYDLINGEIKFNNSSGVKKYLVVFPYQKSNGEHESTVINVHANTGVNVTYGDIPIEWEISTNVEQKIDPEKQFYFVGDSIKLAATFDYTNSKIVDVGRNEEIQGGYSKPYLLGVEGVYTYQIDFEAIGDSISSIDFGGSNTAKVINTTGNNSKKLPSDIKTLKMRSVSKLETIEDPAKTSIKNVMVSHTRKVTEPTEPMSFFVHLLNSSKSIEFNAYQNFINSVLCADTQSEITGQAKNKIEKLERIKRELTDFGVGAYELLKTATEAFLLINGCVTPAHNGNKSFSLHQNLELGDYSRVPREVWTSLFSHYLGDNRLPYIKHIVDSALPAYEVPERGKNPRFCTDILVRSRVNNPCFMELIWSYWHEEAMLVQTINAISRRFQNLRAPGERDPLAHVEIDPLRPLNNILWGYVEEERDRLSIKRRAYEYQHQYGLELYGKAVSNLRPADTRSKFLEAFHNLLNKCAEYFRAKQDTTVDPDGYPMLHAIQELNLILAQGAHNQFGDLAWTSRVEMLMQQWILSRPEIRDFLQSRIMVPHKEAWMPQVDTMKTLQGWSDVAVTHFRDLGVLGEQILLTIRWHNWYEVTNEDEAKGWADLMRPYIQSYIHSYRAATSVELGANGGVDFTMPSVLLRKRLATQHAPR